jgi:uncharacterized membrane protein
MHPVPKVDFSMTEAIRFGWKTTKDHPWIFFFVGIIFLLTVLCFIAGLDSAVSSVDEGTESFLIVISAIIASAVLISWILSLLFLMGMLNISLRCIDQKNTRLLDFITPFPLIGRLVAVSVFYGMIVLGGLILFVIPGIIWAVQYGFCFFLIVDRRMGPWKALVTSSILTWGRKKDLLVFLSIIAVMNIAGFLSLLAGLFVSVPVSILALCHAYRNCLTAADM